MVNESSHTEEQWGTTSKMKIQALFKRPLFAPYDCAICRAASAVAHVGPSRRLSFRRVRVEGPSGSRVRISSVVLLRPVSGEALASCTQLGSSPHTSVKSSQDGTIVQDRVADEARHAISGAWLCMDGSNMPAMLRSLSSSYREGPDKGPDRVCRRGAPSSISSQSILWKWCQT